MENYLHNILKEYFEEITKVEGFLLSVEGFIKYSENSLSEKYDDSTSINSLISSYRDLSNLSNVMNLHFTGFRHELKVSDFKEDIALIVSRECSLTLAQVYEIFESFIKKVLSKFLFHNPSYLNTINTKSISVTNDYEGYRDFVNSLQRQGKNNKKLLWALRKISPFYLKHETDNIWDFNMANWYELVSVIRHAIVHNRQVLTQDVQNTISKNKNNELFDRYYLNEKSFESDIIYTNRVKTGEQICLFNQFAFLIFKSLSRTVNIDDNYYE
jgi:hypothetical protein